LSHRLGTSQLHRLAHQSEQQQINATENSRRSAALFHSAETLNNVSRNLEDNIRSLVQGVSDSLNRAKQVAFEMSSVSEIKKLLESSHQITGVLETAQDLAFKPICSQSVPA
jgi:methyl-accepting chemotaxis protein